MSRIVAVLVLIQIVCSSAFAEVIKQDHVEVRLIKAGSENPDILKVGVHFKIDPEWHIYWKNPGDSGAAPKFELTGGKLQSVSWPYPIRIPVAHLTNFGYDREVVFPLEILPEQKEMTLSLEWLVCKVECIPGFGKFVFNKQSIPDNSSLYQKFVARVPQALDSWNTEYESSNEKSFQFHVVSSKIGSNEIKNLFVFPENGEAFKTALPSIEPKNESLLVSVPRSSNANSQSQSESFTFVVHKTDGEVFSFTKEIKPDERTTSWMMGLILAFIGGMILNLMPCVFPILFLKAFGFLKEPDANKIKRSSWEYSAGVVLTFFLFGALLTALRLSGEAIGWGYQLQNPIVVFSLALLFFLMALNFYGFFEFGDSIAGKAGKLGQSRFLSGSFGTGVLAVVVASPCTAPFMGTALGLTLLLPTYQSLLIFVALGMGMAIPMLVLAYVPGLVRMLPRSGQWMVTLKQFLSFPLLATCLWLLWIMANQRGSDAVFISLSGFLIVTIGIWIHKVSHRVITRWLSWIMILSAVVFSAFLISRTSAPGLVTQASSWAPFDQLLIDEKRKAQPVFVDFTASWCITCQVNKRAVLDTPEIQEFFKSHNVFLVRADWTNHDARITTALAAFKRNSVPFYVYYNKMQEVQTLPELLTKDLVKDLILQGEKK